MREEESPYWLRRTYIYLIMDAQLNIQNGAFISDMH